MFTLGVMIGAFSYLIFFIGIFGFLYKQLISILGLIFIVFLFFYFKKDIFNFLNIKKHFFKRKVFISFLIVLFLQIIINLIGALGPEYGFDATWYHLTLPKLYLLNGKISHIPGGLFYYSDMPKLVEMLYTTALASGNEILTKLIHFTFGILSCIALFKLSRKFFNNFFSFLSVIMFYSNIVVGWESITSYVDLARTFFEILALWSFINWLELKKQKWLILSAIFTGLTITTKLIAFGSLFIFIVLIVISKYKPKASIKSYLRDIFLYIFFSILIPLPWLIFSLINTKNPFYPFFSALYPSNISFSLFSPIKFIHDIFMILTHSDDPISPVFIAVLPLVFIVYKKFDNKLKTICFYSLLSIIAWYITPRTGGGRFILPYLPSFSILTTGIIEKVKTEKLKQALILLVFISAFIGIVYRGVANAKYVPYLLGKETKSDFLSKHLNFNFGDFYDTDGYFKKNIKLTDRVLLIGFHNLYYVDFPFIDSSFKKDSDWYNYIAVQNNSWTMDNNFKLVYFNSKTNVRLYKLK